MNYWRGGHITKLPAQCVFVFGSNPEGRHGAGAAKAAMSFGAVYGQGRGRQGNAYGLVTKNLTRGYVDKHPDGDKVYHYAGSRSVGVKDMCDNIVELYEYAKAHPEMKFLIAYTNQGLENLNGYTPEEMGLLFRTAIAPPNIYMHESYFREDTDDGCKFFDVEAKSTNTKKLFQ
ncbi:hypothetical protein VPHK469_0116 [Vibrio phage K469]